MADVGLRRTLGFWALVAYGVGDILGAGIYALIGKVAGIAGAAAWCSFSLAMAVAAFTALSYAELGGRFPKSAGESYFCSEAFRLPSLSLLVGWLVFASGIVSLATVSRAFADYCLALRPAAGTTSGALIIVGFLFLLAAINYFGIRLSSGANIVCTVVEASGLLIVLAVGLAALSRGVAAPDLGADVAEVAPGGDITWLLVTQGAALAFFAYIGFEDMVNVAEEVHEPARHLPQAIITALVVAGLAYIAISWIATQVVSPEELAQARAPLLLVVQRAAPSFPAWLFTIISLFAVANTGLLNYVMASRLLYGMSQQQLLPSWLAVIDPRTRTPARAIATIFLIALAVALSGTIEFLAGTSSFLLLTVFTIINAALVIIKSRGKVASGFQVPVAVPLVGVVASVALMLAVPRESLLRATAIVAVGILIVAASSHRLADRKR